jgi:type I restriction enzyme S subunit
VRYGSALPASLRNEKGGILVIGSAGKSGFHDLAYHHKPSIVIGRKGSVGSVTYVAVPFWPIDTVFFLDDVSPYLDLRFLAAALEYFGLDRYKIVVGVPGINRSDLERFQFPMPPLTEQRQIVEILHEAEELRRLRSKAETVTGALSSAIFDEMFGSPSAWKGGPKLGDIVRIVGGGTPTKSVEHFYSGAIPWATSKDIKRLYLDDTEDHVTEEAVQSSATNIVPPKTVLVVVKSKILAHSLPMAITNVPMCFGQDLKGLVPNPGVTPEFIVHSLQAQARRVLSRARGANTEGLTLEALKSLTVPNPADPAMRRFAATCEEIGALGKTALAANRLQSLTSASLLAHLFSGQITAAWRKKHGHQLAREAGERDARLRESAHELPPLQAVTVQDWDRFLQMPTEGIYAELNREQRQLLRDIERMVGGALSARYFSARQLGENSLADGPLRRNPHLIEGHLTVLAAHGLIIPVSREEQTEDTGEFVFGNAYRLPLMHYEPAEGARGEVVAGDSSRLRELERLAAQIEKERMLP